MRVVRSCVLRVLCAVVQCRPICVSRAASAVAATHAVTAHVDHRMLIVCVCVRNAIADTPCVGVSSRASPCSPRSCGTLVIYTLKAETSDSVTLLNLSRIFIHSLSYTEMVPSRGRTLIYRSAHTGRTIASLRQLEYKAEPGYE